jgi:hypothetical protein
MSDGLPDNVKLFLRETVSSVEQLEILLHVFNHSAAPMTAEAVAKALYISQEIASDRLQTYANRGILNATGSVPPAYSINSSNSETLRMLAEIGSLYRERRVSLINFIYSAPSSTIQSFADAFIIGKKNT